MAEDLGSSLADAVAPPEVPPKRIYISPRRDKPESWSPEGSPYVKPGETPPTMPSLGEDLSRSAVLPPQPPAQAPIAAPAATPQAELRASPPPAPSERITSGVQQLLSAAGADNYTSNNLATKLMGLVQATPLGAPLAAADAAHYHSQGDAGGTVMSMAGAIPGAKPAATAAKAAVREVAAPAIKRVGSMAEDLANNIRYNYAGPQTVGKQASAGKVAPPNPYIQTVDQPYRMMYPGIYRDPREIARVANEQVVPENPAMKQLWGVNRGDLNEIGKARGPGMDIPDISGLALKPTGAVSAANIMNPRNEARLQNTLYEGGKYPGLAHADAWYVMDPMYHRLEQMFGRDEAIKRYRDLNNMMAMASPGSDVLTEIQRGSAAHWLQNQGRFGDFKNFAGLPETLPRNAKPGAQSRQMLGDAFPDDMRYIMGHPYHPTAQAGPMGKYLQRGSITSDAPKVPSYALASGVPQTGFQTRYAVGDAHYSRGVGLADTRKGPTDVQASWSPTEYQTLIPWWRDKIAHQLGIEAVPAQARLWTILGPQTGVDSPLGQGKLELLSQQIMVAAKRLGITPEQARDKFLRGEIGAGVLAGTAGLGAALGSVSQPPSSQPPPQDQRS